MKHIKNALISTYCKEHLEPIICKLGQLGIKIFSTGGTCNFIKQFSVAVESVESLISYPHILGGRVKTLHPKIFGGILARRENVDDLNQLREYDIPQIDLVIVDLYPFESTVHSDASEQEIIEKIDIGGISLIRAAAKNFNDVLVIPSSEYYSKLLALLEEKNGMTNLVDRKYFALQAFKISSHYDIAIFNYFNNNEQEKVFKQSIHRSHILRYGENPHQDGTFFGDIDAVFNQLNGKKLSYNNLLDIDAAINLIEEFDDTTFAIIKHNNVCGIATRNKLIDAWKDALAGDPISAFGSVLITNCIINEKTAIEINKLFFEIIIAPDYEKNALDILKFKKNRIILQKKQIDFPKKQFKTILNGLIEQSKDMKTDSIYDMKYVTKKLPTELEKADLVYANIIVKHTKSNAIVLAKNRQLLASGIGQTSRIDALKQAIAKASLLGFNLKGAVMASDAFFPFADCVEIAHQAGITAIIQPGGSINDKNSIIYCDENELSMVFTGTRHFKH